MKQSSSQCHDSVPRVLSTSAHNSSKHCYLFHLYLLNMETKTEESFDESCLPIFSPGNSDAKPSKSILVIDMHKFSCFSNNFRVISIKLQFECYN